MTLHIAGGTYREFCKEGEWQQLFGSGLRAAASLQNIDEVELHTYVGRDDAALAESVAATFNVDIHISTTPRTITFLYDHGLSIPLILPPLNIVHPAQQIQLKADQVLRFGMAEGTAVVDGDLVVYDPQSAYSPESFGANGSKARRLVIVCNRREAQILSGETDVVVAANKLRGQEGAEAVVVKCGSHGAVVHSDTGTEHISAFRTDRVWPIGSGDVFAASFFAAWIIGDSFGAAATAASKAAAYYCDTRSLPIPVASDLPAFEPLSLRTQAAGDAKPNIYLAGPFFDVGQRWLVHEARAALLDQGLDVFSPFHDVGFGVASEVVPADIEGIKRADVVFALLDHLDAGTLFEVGYARCLNKPVVGFCENSSDEMLKMLVGTDCELVNDFVSAVYRVAWTALR